MQLVGTNSVYRFLLPVVWTSHDFTPDSWNSYRRMACRFLVYIFPWIYWTWSISPFLQHFCTLFHWQPTTFFRALVKMFKNYPLFTIIKRLSLFVFPYPIPACWSAVKSAIRLHAQRKAYHWNIPASSIDVGNFIFLFIFTFLKNLLQENYYLTWDYFMAGVCLLHPGTNCL